MSMSPGGTDILAPCRHCQVTATHANSSYDQISNIRHTLVVNKIVDHSDVVGASPVGAAPTTSSFLILT